MPEEIERRRKKALKQEQVVQKENDISDDVKTSDEKQTERHLFSSLSDFSETPAEKVWEITKSIGLYKMQSPIAREPLRWDQLGFDMEQEEVDSGVYIILGPPASGKTLLGRGVFKYNAEKAVYVSVLEPVTSEDVTLETATTDTEIEQAFRIAFTSDKPIGVIDSSRFLNSVGKFPARAKGIQGGLDYYATVFDSIAKKNNKIIFMIVSTIESSRVFTDIYADILKGATQGVFIPETLESTGLISGRVTIRKGDRAMKSFGFYTNEEIVVPFSSEFPESSPEEAFDSELQDLDDDRIFRDFPELRTIP